MEHAWYSVAVSALILGCGGTTEVGGNGNDTSTGGATNIAGTGGTNNIDSGTPLVTGGTFVAYYGVRASGGSPTGGASTGCPTAEPMVGTYCSGDATCNYGRGIDCAFPCDAGCTVTSSNGTPIRSGLIAHSVCKSNSWTLVTDGSCPTAADCQCGTADSSDRITELTASCEASGGTVVTSQCCTSTGDFPRSCNTAGACGCSPTNSKATLVCNCPGSCFDGTACVSY